MSKRKHGRNGPKNRGPGKLKNSLSSRRLFAAGLHRRPCLWDVLIHELTVDLSNRCWQIRNTLSTNTFRFDSEESTAVGWMLGRGFEVLISRNWAAGPCDGLGRKLWQLDETSAGQIAERTASLCFDPLLRKYVEDARDIHPGWPHDDLSKLTGDLDEALRSFLISRCSSGGDLHKCLMNPLADHSRYFPDNGRSADPANSCGDPIRDVYRLGLTVCEEDDGGDIKWKLSHFVRNDPWLFAEWISFVQWKRGEIEDRERIDDRSMAVDQATDEFIFRATHLDGKTPIQLFVERQEDISDRQKQRLLRWDRETFCGTFLVREVELLFISATDVSNDRNYRLRATKPEGLHSLKSGDLLLSRVAPWDDYWLLSGIQQRFEGAGKDKDLVSKLKLEASYRPPHYHIDSDDPSIRKGFEIQEAQYQAWIVLFGQEELLFEDGLELGAAINRFDRYWTDEMILPESGLTRAQLYRQKHGHAPPKLQFPLPEELLEAKDTVAVFDRRHGLAFYVGYGLFRSAFQDQGTVSPEQMERVWDYLTAESIDYWLFQRMRDRYPARTEYVFKQVLKDERFRLDRDFDAVLRRFKGESMRRPVRPMITVIDSEADDKTIVKVLK